MTTHELARKLLDGPDELVYVVDEDASLPELVDDIEVLNAGEWHLHRSLSHHYTEQEITHDSSGNPLPDRYMVVMGGMGYKNP